MDLDEIVETSDAEEQQELEAKVLEPSKFQTRNVRGTPENPTPPRKKMKHFHEPGIEERILTLSPIKSESTGVNTPQRSRSSSTMFTTNTSPGPLFTSRSPTQSPGRAYDILNLPKQEEEEMSLEMSPPPPENSQDPLLLHSPTRPSVNSLFSSLAASPANDIVSMSIPQTTTPINSPTRQLNGLSSPPLFFPYSPLPNSPKVLSSKSPQGTDKIDELLMFTPTKAPSQQSLFSPLTPATIVSPSLASVRSITSERRRYRSLSQTSDRSVSPGPNLPAVVAAPQPQEDASVALAHELDERSRYSFRARNVKQMRPYTTDDIIYKQQLKAIPEAIVKNKALHHHQHHHHPEDRYEEDGETQQDVYVDDGTIAEDDAAWEERERRRKRRREELQQHATAEQDATRYPGILQGLPDTDEEEDKQMDAVTKEARRMMKQKAREKKAKEKEEQEEKEREERLKAKRFPVSKRALVLPKSPKPQPSTSASDNIMEDGESPRHIPHASNNPPAFRQASNQPSSPLGAAAVMRDYIDQEDDFEMYNHDEPYNHDDPHNHDNPVEWDENPAVYQRASASPSPLGILTNSYETTIHVGLDQDETRDYENGNQHSRSQSSGESTGFELDLERKKELALRKMYPAFMIPKLVKNPEALETLKPKPQRPPEKPKTYDEDGHLLPGRTRVQTAVNPKDIRDIKGDSESELDIDSNSDRSLELSEDSGESDEGDSDSDANDILFVYSRRTVKLEKPDVIDLTKSHYSDTNEAGPSKPTYFRRHKAARRKVVSGRLQDPSMINYMLARSSNLEPSHINSEDPPSTSHRRQSKFKHDILTGDGRKYGRERQTLLTFHIDSTSNKGHARKIGKRPKPFRSNHNQLSDEVDASPEGWDGDASDYRPDISAHVTESDWKQKKRIRRQKEKTLGLYTFNPGNQVISSGSHPRRLFATINPEYKESFTTSLPPSHGLSTKKHWSEHYIPPPVERIRKPPSTSASIISEEPDAEALSNNREIVVPSDLDVPVLRPGMSFCASTYIKKGWLYQLTTIAVNVQQAPLFSTILLGFDLGPDMGVDQFCSLLPNIGEGLLEFATGLPDPDFDVTRTQWSLVMRAVSQLTSWYLKSAVTEDVSALRTTLQKEILRLVGQIEQIVVTFIDTPILAVCWFLVDLSARLRYQLPPPMGIGSLEKPLKDSASILMRLLLQFGVKKTMQSFLDDIELDGTSPAQYSAELWVCLIHVLGMSTNTDAENKPKNHPFWLLLKDALTARVDMLNTRTPYETSEDVWRTILSACTLSQFSVHGMTLTHSHLPAYWDIVSFALRRMYLAKPTQNDGKPSLASKNFDRYIALVVVRCDHLRDRYKWSLADATSMFNNLAEIFRARKFANLLHEGDKFSNFFYHANWELLSFRDPRDTAYTIFLKLIVQAAKDDKLCAAAKPSPQVRKLLSIAIPVGSLPFTKENEPQGNELSKFSNRMCAMAIAGDLDRSSINDRIYKARSYIFFAKADGRSRFAVIRGIKNWAVMLVHRNMSIKSFGPWVEEIAKVLDTEIKECPGLSTEGKATSPEAELLLKLARNLFIAARMITEACTKHSRYPYLFVLESLKPLIICRKLNLESDEISLQFLYFLNALFDARSAALPPPSRPTLQVQPLPAADEESQESQDFGLTDDFANMDWSAVDLPADLAAPAKAAEEPNYDDDNSFRDAMKTMQIVKWAVYRGLKPHFQDKKQPTNLCDFWLRPFLGFSVVEGQPSAWTSSLELLDKELRSCPDEHWLRRIQLSIMFQALKLDPMLYLTYTERAFGAFLNALVSDDNDIVGAAKSHKNTVEREYVSWLLSIDGLRHPLLSDMADFPPRNEISGDYEFTADEFLDLRLPLLQGIFKNLEKYISLQLEGALEVPLDTGNYVALCASMFSGMRNNLTRLPKISDKFTQYHDFCHRAVDVLQGNRELCERMKFWAQWRP